MTTIIGVQGDGFSIICTDSRISTIDDGGFASQITTLGKNSSKVAVNGKYLLGAAGDVRAINILHHVFQPPPPNPGLTGSKLDQFFTSKFIPSLRATFEVQGYAAPERDESSHIAEQGSTVICSVHGSIYVVDGDYSWTSDVSGLYALGTGSSYALGAMSVLFPKKKSLNIPQAKTLCLKAIAVSAKFDPYTGPPYYCYVQEEL
jgi:ATP-dependent protease HslVU (ClpYQ) peptidase subunit